MPFKNNGSKLLNKGRFVMSRVCDICGKGPLNGNLRSHAMNATKRKFYPNIQKIRAEIQGVVRGVRICVSCLKTNKIKKVV